MYGAIHALIRNRKKTGGTPEGETEGTTEGKTGGNTRRQGNRPERLPGCGWRHTRTYRQNVHDAIHTLIRNTKRYNKRRDVRRYIFIQRSLYEGRTYLI